VYPLKEQHKEPGRENTREKKKQSLRNLLNVSGGLGDYFCFSISKHQIMSAEKLFLGGGAKEEGLTAN
jgi:hypothetical protein